jgi:asparagine synthase (glutamine-hydrolysing)
MVDRMLAVDMRFTLADSDLPKVNAACGLAGVMVRYPWLDDRLVAFAATLPTEQKVRGTQLRYLFKQALRGFLPEEIIAKRKQGFGLPFGVWLRDHQGLRDLAGDSLQSLAGRGLLRRDAVDGLLGVRHQEHAAYYGTFIWILMMLEQWLAGHNTERAWI